MKLLRLFSLLLVLFAVAQVAAAQSHTVTLTWNAPTDQVASSTYNVYRASGACPVSGLGTLTWAKINAAAITGLTYSDAGVAVGTFCYYATQVQNSAESLPSNTAPALVRPNTVTITITLVV